MSLRRSQAPRVSLAALCLRVPHGSRGTTILIDLEGSHSTERERSHDFRIFNVGFILSSVILFNQKSLMNNAATLDMLEFSTQAKLCRTSAGAVVEEGLAPRAARWRNAPRRYAVSCTSGVHVDGANAGEACPEENWTT